MKSYNLVFSAAPSTQEVRDTGRGHVDRIVINHDEVTAQTVSFYDRDGVLLSQYLVHPTAARLSSISAAGDPWDSPMAWTSTQVTVWSAW